MRRLNFYLIFICLLLSSINSGFAQSLRSYSPEDQTFYLKTGDGHEEYTVNGTISFKCVKSGVMPGFRDAGVTFAPANPGEVIQVKIEEIDLDGVANYLLLYNGYIKTGYSGASNGSGQASYMPAGWFDKVGASAMGRVYTSESADGKLTFGLHSSNAGNQKGFTITVTSMTAKDMEFVSAGAFLNNPSVNRGGRNQILLGANIKMDGGGNPQTLSELTFNTSVLSSTQIENIRIYSTDKFTDANLLASQATPSASVSLNNVTLRNGENKFYLVANVKADALATIPSPSLTSVKIDNVAKSIAPNSSQNPIAIANDILIAKEHLIYTISEDANFYDDGGKSGKISDKFEGTITFRPSTVGKKIKIDFSKLEIFNTSSTGNNDVLKFYNGQTVDEQQLVATLLKEAKIVKSTAEDGSLTVTLKSITGVPANGWEAIVSEFTPGPMSFDALNVSQLSTATLAGSNTNEQFLLLNIKATNILDPIVLQSVNFDATGTTNIADISKAKLYYLGETSTFNTQSLFGEVDIMSLNYQINGSRVLKEGNNYLALVYDITSAASNGDLIVASVGKATISGEEKLPQTALTASRIVANVFKSQKGNHTREFHDAWTYTDTKSTINSSVYEFQDEDHFVTFKPAIEGVVTEIDFSTFDVYYATTSYGVKAVFEVYSGTSLTADNLLWKLSDNAQSKTGPGKKLRSKASDGSITIKFNAKTTSSYYAATGWKATVTPFVNHAMTVETVDALQTNKSNLRPSAVKQEIIGFSVKTEGDLSAQKVKEVTVGLKNSESVINKVSILYSADQKDFSKAVLFGSTTDLSAQEVIIKGEQALPEGTSFFWVAYDIKDVVPTDVVVDAKLISLKTEDVTTYTPTNGDPEGHRLTKNEYLLSAGDNGTVTINNPILFYDNGGSENVYSLNFDGKVTFLPSEAGKVVRMTFNSFRTASTHYLYLYNGTEVNEANLIGKYSFTTFPESVFSKADNGAITARFVSTTGTANAGWEIAVDSYTTKELFVESIKTSTVTNRDVLRGSIKTPVQKIEVKVGGDKGNLSLNNFTFENSGTTNASDIATARLYYTNASSGFIADNQIGQDATTAPYSFSFDQNVRVKEPGTYYFWLAYDIKNDATVGNKVAVSLKELAENAVVNSNITTSTIAERTIKAGFKGTYTIGKSAGADYPTFATAISALEGGVEGAVKFNVQSGTYAENIKVKAIEGTSALHNITFSSLSGNNDDVIVIGSGYSEPPYGEQKYGMVAVEGTSHVTFENMSFIPTVQTYPYAVHIMKASRYFTLKNSVIQATPITTGYSGMNLFYMEPQNVEGSNSDYVTIENNSLSGGYIALYMGGASYVDLTQERGAIIRNNTITNAGSKGIYLTDEQDALIENNTVISTATQKTGYTALDIYRNRGSLIIRNNKIVNSQAFYSTGINLRQDLKGTADKPLLVYNNSIAITASNSSSSYGFDLVSDCSFISFYNNTINISGTYGYAFGISKTYDGIKGVLLQNNLIQSNTTSPLFYINKLSQLSDVSFKNNTYYAKSAKLANIAGDNLAAWTTTTKDATSFEAQADFISPSDLHLKTLGNLNAGLAVDFITTDTEGKSRNQSAPTVGAYEYEVIAEVKPEIEATYPKTGTATYNSIEFRTKWNQSGSQYRLVKKATEETPTKADLLATTAISLNKGEENLSRFTSLNEETEYKAYFLFVSALNVQSDIVATSVVKTPKRIYPLAVTLPTTSATIAAGAEVSLSARVSGAVYPYNYEWKNQMDEVVSKDSILTISPTVVQKYSLTITSSDKQSKVLYTDVLVRGESKIATFEDNYLAPESYWQGLDEDGESKFYSGSYSFTNTHYPSMLFWGGFGYSNVTATDFEPNQFETHQFRSVVGQGAEKSKTFSMVYTFGAETKVSVINSETGQVIPGVYLTNAAYTMNSMVYGDSFVGEPFKQGDFYKVTFKGTTPTKATTTVEYYLADYRSTDVSKHYMLTDWKWFDLSSLGVVTTVTISVDGSRKGSHGLDTPAYLCMDNFGASEPLPVGLNPESVNSLHIYPVPTSDVLNISTSESDYTVKIYNLQGQLVKSEFNLKEDAQLDVTNLNAGNYILEVISENGRQVKRFIKK